MTVNTFNPLTGNIETDSHGSALPPSGHSGTGQRGTGQRGTDQRGTGITLTRAAADHIRRQMANQADTSGFRIGVRKSGCSGYMYVVDLVREPRPDDIRFEVDQGLAIFVDTQSLPVLDGTEVDFVSEGLNRVFRFNNPNTDASCGCGESFSIKSGAI